MKQKQIQTNVRIGLEIHGYLITKEKLFCACENQKVAKPNSNICPICTGQPGSKPMLPNMHAIRNILAIALMLGCKINEKFFWQRKHYDWPDLPKGFQNTISGAHSIPVGQDGNFLGIRIREVHLEEDPAKWDPDTGKVDYNRSGIPLVEIVTEPDFTSSKHVAEWLKQLVITLSYIKALEKDAGIKADVNVSVNSERVEVKNVNSISNIVKAIEFEIERQQKLLQEGKEVKRETRAFIEGKGITVAMRAKELAEDYRFIPEPDLPAVKIPASLIKELESSLPEKPQEKIEKFVTRHKLREREAKILAKERELAEFFEEIMGHFNERHARVVAEWISTELFRVLNYNRKRLHDTDIKVEHFVELMKLVIEKKITPLTAKSLLNKFVPKSFSTLEYFKKEKIAAITEEKELERICKDAIRQNQEAVEDYKKGEENALHFLIGKVMQATKGKADASVVNEIMKRLLG
ncbi:MAG: Asp-tRNA(Asn)/Glu-tRNA(Gln) amidotransferase subunit GatB [Nanoarchaeota archaeon]